MTKKLSNYLLCKSRGGAYKENECTYKNPGLDIAEMKDVTYKGYQIQRMEKMRIEFANPIPTDMNVFKENINLYYASSGMFAWISKDETSIILNKYPHLANTMDSLFFYMVHVDKIQTIISALERTWKEWNDVLKLYNNSKGIAFVHYIHMLAKTKNPGFFTVIEYIFNFPRIPR